MIEQFKWHAQVRDYEVDMYGVVNHATYIHYLEEGRNEYARHCMKFDLQDFLKKGYSFAIAGLEIQYRRPLFPQAKFYITSRLESYDNKRQYYVQEIRLEEKDALVSKAVIHVACVDVNTGRACFPDELRLSIETHTKGQQGICPERLLK
jgi:acyl-CoA thioester hydrolase